MKPNLCVLASATISRLRYYDNFLIWSVQQVSGNKASVYIRKVPYNWIYGKPSEETDQHNKHPTARTHSSSRTILKG